MKVIPTIAGFEYERLNYSDLEVEILDMENYGWEVHDLGESSDPTKKLYMLSYGDINTKPVIYYQGNIHGNHEWQTAHWNLGFNKQLHYADNPYHREVFERLKQKYAFISFPSVNPYGYDKDTSQYANANGVSIDRNFDYSWEYYKNIPSVNEDTMGTHPFSEPEALAIKNIIDTYKPLTLFCCHTHGGYTGLSIRPQVLDDYNVLIQKGFESTVLSHGGVRKPAVGEDGDSYLVKLHKRPTAYNWAGTQLSSNGKPIIGCAIESGSEETNIMKAQMGMNALLSMILQVDDYYTNNVM